MYDTLYVIREMSLLHHYFLIQTSFKVDVAAIDLEHFHPSIVGKMDTGMEKETEAFLVAERRVICKVPACQAPLVLVAAYYAFNMSYPKVFVHFV